VAAEADAASEIIEADAEPGEAAQAEPEEERGS